MLLFHARFACHFPLQFRKTIGSQSEAGNQIGDVLHAEEFKKKKKNMHPIKNLCLWSKMPAVLQRTQSPRTCLLLYRAIDVHTSAPALLKLGTSNITEPLLQMGYCFMKLIIIMILEIAEDKGCTCCYLLVTANFPTTFLVIHN